MYSPGNAFVVYDMRRHVYDGHQQTLFTNETLEEFSNLSNSTVPSHDTLDVFDSQHYRHMHNHALSEVSVLPSVTAY